MSGNVMSYGYMKDIFVDDHYLFNPMGADHLHPGAIGRGKGNQKIDPAIREMSERTEEIIKMSRGLLAYAEAKMFRSRSGRIRISYKGKTIGGFYPKTYAAWADSYKVKFWEKCVNAVDQGEVLKYQKERLLSTYKTIAIRRHTDAEESRLSRQEHHHE